MPNLTNRENGGQRLSHKKTTLVVGKRYKSRFQDILHFCNTNVEWFPDCLRHDNVHKLWQNASAYLYKISLIEKHVKTRNKISPISSHNIQDCFRLKSFFSRFGFPNMCWMLSVPSWWFFALCWNSQIGTIRLLTIISNLTNREHGGQNLPENNPPYYSRTFFLFGTNPGFPHIPLLIVKLWVFSIVFCVMTKLTSCDKNSSASWYQISQTKNIVKILIIRSLIAGLGIEERFPLKSEIVIRCLPSMWMLSVDSW